MVCCYGRSRVKAFPDKGNRVQISNSGGLQPVWSHTASELFFRTWDQIMTVSYTIKGGEFVAEKPRVWSEKRLAWAGLTRNFDLAPDGKRIVALLNAEEAKAQSHVVFLMNFTDELLRRFSSR